MLAKYCQWLTRKATTRLVQYCTMQSTRITVTNTTNEHEDNKLTSLVYIGNAVCYKITLIINKIH